MTSKTFHIHHLTFALIASVTISCNNVQQSAASKSKGSQSKSDVVNRQVLDSQDGNQNQAAVLDSGNGGISNVSINGSKSSGTGAVSGSGGGSTGTIIQKKNCANPITLPVQHFSLRSHGSCAASVKYSVGNQIGEVSSQGFAVSSTTGQQAPLYVTPLRTTDLLKASEVQICADDLSNGTYDLTLCVKGQSSCGMIKNRTERDYAMTAPVHERFIYFGMVSTTEIATNGNPFPAAIAARVQIENQEALNQPPLYLFQDDSTVECSAGQSPLMLNLDGKRFEFNPAPMGVDFDLTGDCNTERVSCPKAQSNTALLAIDRNGDGRINDVHELFGNNTVGPNGKQANGFLSLAAYDSDANRIIDKRDMSFAQLRLWNDRNADGITDAGELLTLDEGHVVSIDLDYVVRSESDLWGNELREISVFEHATRGLEPIIDVWLTVQ